MKVTNSPKYKIKITVSQLTVTRSHQKDKNNNPTLLLLNLAFPYHPYNNNSSRYAKISKRTALYSSTSKKNKKFSWFHHFTWSSTTYRSFFAKTPLIPTPRTSTHWSKDYLLPLHLISQSPTFRNILISKKNYKK